MNYGILGETMILKCKKIKYGLIYFEYLLEKNK